MDNTYHRRSRIYLAVVLFVIVIVVLGVVSSLSKRDKVEVSVSVAPQQSVIAMDGKKTGDKIYVNPGPHTLTVSLAGFDTYTKKFEAKSGESKLVLTAALSPKSAEAKKIAADQAALYTKIEGISGEQVQNEGEEFVKNYPIVSSIPYKTSYYSIDYGKDNSGNFVVQITANSPLGRQVALQRIKDWGYDLTTYRVEFVGFQNPFDALNTGIGN